MSMTPEKKELIAEYDELIGRYDDLIDECDTIVKLGVGIIIALPIVLLLAVLIDSLL